MSHLLRFASRAIYDASEPSISLPVRVTLGAEHVTAEAKLDTGASHAVFRRELGEDLGLVVDTGHALRIETVTGWFRAYGHAVTLTALDISLDTVVYFAAEYGFPKNVLGRRGFIDRLRLGLVDYDGLLLASHYDDPQDDEDAG